MRPFPEEEWERESQVILNEFNMGKDDPDRVMQKLAASTAYHVHPYRVPIIGYEDIFTSMTRAELLDFFDEHYVPDNMITVVVGDFDSEQVLQALRKTFENFKRRSRTPVVLPEEPAQLSRRMRRKEGAYNVTRMRVMYHTVSLSDEDAPALDVLAAIVGQGRSSRLNRSIKEKQKLVHSIGAWSYTPKYPGSFGVYAVLDPDKEADALTAIDEEVASWLDSGFSDEEMAKARRMVISSELSSLQTANGQADNYASGEFYVGDPRFSEVYIRQIHDVTEDDLRRVARKYLLEPNSSVAVLGPPLKTEDAADEAAQIIASPMSMKTLKNGMRVVVREDHKLPFVYMSLVAGGGQLGETAETQGITKLMSDMLIRGTENRSADEISDFVESHGGAIKPFAGRNSFGIQVRCLTDDASAFMELLAECAMESAFPRDHLDLQRNVQLAALRQDQERPFSTASESLKGALFPEHPYRFNTLGTEDSLGSFSKSDLEKYREKHVVAGNLVLSIFGDVTTDDVVKLASKTFSKVSTEPAPAVAIKPAAPELPATLERRVP